MRHDRFLADEPYTRCKPSPGPRSLGTAYGVKLLNLLGSSQYHLFVIGGHHTYRVIYMYGLIRSAWSPATSAIQSAGGRAIRW
jgi:hypothetical protein